MTMDPAYIFPSGIASLKVLEKCVQEHRSNYPLSIDKEVANFVLDLFTHDLCARHGNPINQNDLKLRTKEYSLLTQGRFGLSLSDLQQNQFIELMKACNIEIEGSFVIS